MALVWLCVCVFACVFACVYVWRGLNRQQLPQGRVYSVDMLLKQNFLILQLISHFMCMMNMSFYRILRHIDTGLKQANNLYCQALVTGFLSKAQCFLSNKTLSLPNTRQTDITTAHFLSQSDIVLLRRSTCSVFHINPAEEALKCSLQR